MIIRSIQANKLYHELISQLHTHKTISIFDGRFTKYNMPNPVRLRPSAFHIETFRELMKALDLDYKRSENGLVESSAKLTQEELGSHINFLEVLLMETR